MITNTDDNPPQLLVRDVIRTMTTQTQIYIVILIFFYINGMKKIYTYSHIQNYSNI